MTEGGEIGAENLAGKISSFLPFHGVSQASHGKIIFWRQQVGLGVETCGGQEGGHMRGTRGGDIWGAMGGDM